MPHLPKKQPKRSYMPQRKRTASKYGNDAYNFYKSQAWRRCSIIYRKNNVLCEVCKSKPARVVDHIVRIESDEQGQPLPIGGAAWDERNHMAMCHGCHNRKRGKEGHGFTVSSKRTSDGLIPMDRKEIIIALRGGE